jgi:hypothetical protein
MAKRNAHSLTKSMQVETAIMHLRLVQHGQHLVGIYRELFPREFAKYRIDYSSVETVIGFYDRLCQLINRHMFPCDPYSMVWWSEYGEEEIGWRLMEVPAAFWSRCWLDKMEKEYTPVERMILSATGLAEITRPEVPKPAAGHIFSESLLKKLCAKARSPIRHLPQVVLAVIASTNNFYVDASDDELCQMEGISWDIRTLRGMAEEFAEAKQIWAIVDKFNKWANAKPEHLKQIAGILRRSVRPKDVEQRVRVASSGEFISPRPLYETLEMHGVGL